MAEPSEPTREERELIEILRRHPELGERLKRIGKLARSGRLRADEVEEQLVMEVRKLGKTVMESWAGEAEEHAAREFRKEHPQARYGKKKR